MQSLMDAPQERLAGGRARARPASRAPRRRVNVMDARLSALVRKGEVDAGLFYVPMRNQQDPPRPATRQASG